MNHPRPFLMRLDILAKLPLTAAWFPYIGLPDQGVIAGAPRALQAELTSLGTHVLRRCRALLKMRGS